MHLRSALLLLALAAAASPAAAQKDYRNLDDDRPVLTEDALPVERGQLELMLPARAERAASGVRALAVYPELMWGAFRGGHVGVKVPLVTAQPAAPGSGVTTLAPELFAFANLRAESPAWPAVALRADVGLPGVGASQATFTLKGIATRSFGAARVHVNAAFTAGADSGAALPTDAPSRWWLSAAIDHSVWRRGMLLVGEIVVQRAVNGEPVQVHAAIGARAQLAPDLVLDAGLARRLSASGNDLAVTAGLAWALPTRGVGSGVRPGPGSARRDDVMYPAGAFNWQFLGRYPAAARLFNAFDYGHAILYEQLWTEPGVPRAALDSVAYAWIVDTLLRQPPRLPVAEDAIFPGYARVAYRATRMFDWAHLLHRQIYDLYATPALDEARRDARIEQLIDGYLANRRDAFTSEPKAMELMDGQPFSTGFRRGYPRFNGLIWAYHWLQAGLYEPFLATSDTTAQRALVDTVRARFFAMVDGHQPLPAMMPLMPGVAPRFATAHPRAAIIFDNLHMMHDIISDILVDARIPRPAKGAAIARQLDEFQRGDRNVLSREEWWTMTGQMGGEGPMGGAALPGSRPVGGHGGGHRH